MGRLWGPIHHNVNLPFSAKASSPSSDPLKRELSVWIGITREIWGVPSHKVGGAPGVGSRLGRLWRLGVQMLDDTFHPSLAQMWAYLIGLIIYIDISKVY